MQAKAAIGLDVGGTRVKAVVVEDEGTVLDQVVRQSLDNGVERWAEVAQALVQELIEQYGEELSVGVCAAGLADGNESCIWNLPNRMPGIEGLNWQRFLGRPEPFLLSTMVRPHFWASDGWAPRRDDKM